MHQSRDRINEVIQSCIEHCHTDYDPAEQVHAFAAGLKAAGWSEIDADFVANAAMQAIRAADGTK